MTESWALLALGTFALFCTVPGIYRVDHWALLFPAFVVSWIGTGLGVWWLVLTTGAAGALAASGGLSELTGWVGLAFVLAAEAGLIHQWVMARRATATFDTELKGLDGMSSLATRRTVGSVLLPFWVHDRRVGRTKNIRYADAAKRRHLLDVYRPRGDVRGAPVLLQIHGGAWMIGTKDTQGRPLMNAASNAGWVCVAINYRLSPRSKWPDHLLDCKLAIRWIREHIAEYGGDPDSIVVTGGSAGGHLAALVGLTANDPEYQPDFPDVDTSVRACVPMYGAYDLEEIFGRYDSRFAHRLGSWMGSLVTGRGLEDAVPYRAASPVHRVAPGAPPFLVVHGTIDNLVPVEQARHLVERLREAGGRVAYVELAGAPHAFDVFHSTWGDASVAGVLRYLTWVVGRADPIAATGDVGSAATGDVGSAATDPTTMARTAPS